MTAALRNPLQALRIRNFRLFLTGQFVSLIGTWGQRVAQDWLVLELTNSGSALGIVTALQFGPTLLLSMYGGALADRRSKRKLLIGTQTLMGSVAVALGILNVSGVVELWHVMVLASLLGVGSALDAPIRQSFASEMVDRQSLANAVALNATAFNVARLVGPALAGIGISAFGTGWVFLVNGASTLAVLLALTMMRTEELYPSPAAKRSAGQYGAVVHYVRARPDLVLPFVLSFVVGTLSASYPVTLAMIAKQLFHRDAGAYGLLTAMLAVGAVAGALVATQRRRRPSRAFVLLAALAFGVTECGAGLMPTFTTTAIALIPAGLAMLVFSQGANAMVQLGVEPSMRGRVLGLYMLCMLGGTPVGSIAVGWLGQHAGPRWGLVGGGLCCIAITVTIGAVLLRRQPAPIRRIQTRLVPVRT